MTGQVNIGASLVGVDSGNFRVGAMATASFATHTGQVVTIQNGIITNVMPSGGGSAINTAYISNITSRINEIAADVNAVNPCALIQALVNQVMGDLQIQITGIEAEISALLPIIQIPSANLGAIVAWITSFVGPSIKAYANYMIQLAQMVAAIASLTAAIEAAVSRIENCSVTITPPTVTVTIT